LAGDERWVITTLLLKSAYYYKGIRYPFGGTYVVSKNVAVMNEGGNSGWRNARL
jgi:hypothetical protein